MYNRRKVFLMLATVLATVLSSLLVAGPAQAATTFYNLKNFGSDKCVDVRTQNDITVQLWSCGSADNKKFNFEARTTDTDGATLFRIIPKSNQFNCLAPTNPTNVAGAAIVSTSCDTQFSFRDLWRRDARTINGQTWYEYQNRLSRLCLTVRGGAGANGTIIEQNTCAVSPADTWRI